MKKIKKSLEEIAEIHQCWASVDCRGFVWLSTKKPIMDENGIDFSEDFEPAGVYEADYSGAWQDSPTAPPVDWMKVPVDTPVMIRNNKKNVPEYRHFALYVPCGEYKYICFTHGNKQNTAYGSSSWRYCRLATPEEISHHEAEKCTD